MDGDPIKTRKRQPSINSQSFVISDDYISDQQREEDSDDSSSMNSSSETTEIPSTKFEFDPKDYLTATIENALDGIELDKSIVLQAQVSGMLNSKTLEVLQLQKQVQERLNSLKELANSKVGQIKTMQRNLIWSDKHLKKLHARFKEDYPIEYNQAKEKVLERSTHDT